MATLGELRSWQATDVGQVRDQNEDNFLVDRKLRLYIVCDGMGGHAAGEIASSMTCKEVREALLEEKDKLLAYDQGAANITRHDIVRIFEAAVQRACQRVHQIGVEDESKRGMGTTLDALLILGGRGFIAHVGDSRIYLSRGGSVHQLTEDHSLINELLKRGKLTREQIATVNYKNAVTRAMAVYESVEADVLDFDVLPGDRYLLCSDGLHGYLEEAEIPKLFGEIAEDALVDHLIRLANERGGKDNITAVVVQVPKGEAGSDDLAAEVHLKLEVLHRLPLFRSVTYQELVRILNVTTVRAYKPGEDVVREGEDGDELLVVLKGTLRVHTAGVDRGKLVVGDSIGELTLVDRTRREATVTANEPCRLLSMKRRDFFDLVRKDRDVAVKLLWALNQVIAQRLRATAHDLVDARSELTVMEALVSDEGADG